MIMTRRRVPAQLRGAHATRVLVSATRRNLLHLRDSRARKKFARRVASPARGSRALPGIANRAFTLIELLVVMAIIIILAGLVVATTGYVQEKGKRSRTEAEIAAISAALENYKADNGIYPTETSTTETLNPATAAPNTYASASAFLYRSLAGDPNGDRISEEKSYFDFKPNMLIPTAPATPVTAIRDSFGNSYGYSTMRATGGTGGFNPTFDLWSTAGTEGATAADQAKWIKNW